MNHAEKAEPLPPCRGAIKGNPARGVRVLLCLLDIISWTGKSFDFRNILNSGEVEFFIKYIDSEVCGPYHGLLESKYNNFSEYIGQIFITEDDLCDIIENKYGENLHANIVRRWLKMSPIQFVDFMNSGQGPVCAWEEEFRKHDFLRDDPFFNTRDLQNECFTFHVIDWLGWQKARIVESNTKNKGTKFTEADLLNKAIRITEMESQLAAKDVELEQARQEKAALQAELEKTRAELEQARQAEGQGLKWYGLIAVIEQCWKEGKNPQETAACLKGAGASWAMIGGLMHPQGNITDWQQYGKNLFNGSTKTLPW